MSTFENLPWKKIAIGTGIGFVGVVAGLTIYNSMKAGAAQQAQQGSQSKQVQQTSQAKQAQQNTQGKQVQQPQGQPSIAAGQNTQPAPQTVQQAKQAQQPVDNGAATGQMQQIGQIDYYNWNQGNKPAKLGGNYVDVANYYRYNPTGGDLPSLHQQESRLMSEGQGTAELIHDENEMDMFGVEGSQRNHVQPRNQTNVGAVVLDASLDISPVVPISQHQEAADLDNFWDQAGEPIHLRPTEHVSSQSRE